MINIFGQNMKKDKCDGIDIFTSRTVDFELTNKADEQACELGELQKKASLPLFLNIIYYVSLLLAVIITGGMLKSLDSVNLKDKIDLILFIIGVVLWIIFAILFIIKYLKNKKIENSDEFKIAIEETEKVYNDSLENLNVPHDSAKVDIFIYPYKQKKEKIVQALKLVKYFAFEFRLFKENNNLCIADISTVISIPLSSFKKIEKINKKISFNGWNKEEAFNKGIYKEYKIKKDDNENMWIKSYYRFELEYDYNQYEFYVPAYDAKPFIDLINLDVIEDNVNEVEETEKKYH